MQTAEDIELIRRAKARRLRLAAKCRRDPDVRDLHRQVENLTEENRILRERLNTLDAPTTGGMEVESPAPNRRPGRPRSA
jgi:hypothetical protein